MASDNAQLSQGASTIRTLAGSQAPWCTWRTTIIVSVVSPVGVNDHVPSTPL
jgi:hypothetical protein